MLSSVVPSPSCLHIEGQKGDFLIYARSTDTAESQVSVPPGGLWSVRPGVKLRYEGATRIRFSSVMAREFSVSVYLF